MTGGLASQASRDLGISCCSDFIGEVGTLESLKAESNVTLISDCFFKDNRSGILNQDRAPDVVVHDALDADRDCKLGGLSCQQVEGEELSCRSVNTGRDSGGVLAPKACHWHESGG